jgi:hypothetical protein
MDGHRERGSEDLGFIKYTEGTDYMRDRQLIKV